MITDIEEQILKSMLGAHLPKGRRGYRNRYFASKDSINHNHLLAMERMGLVVPGKPLNENHLCWHATTAGCRELGFDDDEIERALEA